MKKLFEKKQWMMLSLVAALGVAVYLNYYFTSEPLLQAGTSGEPESSVSEGTQSRPLGSASFVQEGASSAADGEAKPVQGSVSQAGENAAVAKKGYFDRARETRTQAREEAVRTLEDTLGGAGASAKEKATAAEQATAIAENILQESNIENLVMAKGFSDCVAFIENGACSVVVSAGELKAAECLQVLEIVMAQTGLAAKNIQITAAKDK